MPTNYRTILSTESRTVDVRFYTLFSSSLSFFLFLLYIISGIARIAAGAVATTTPACSFCRSDTDSHFPLPNDLLPSTASPADLQKAIADFKIRSLQQRSQIVTATIAVPSSLLSSMTHPTTIMMTKEKSSIRKPTITSPSFSVPFLRRAHLVAVLASFAHPVGLQGRVHSFGDLL